METVKISSQVLDQLHYINFPPALSAADLNFLENKVQTWAALPVELHVLDLKGLAHGSERFFKVIGSLSQAIPSGHMVSLNMTESLKAEVAAQKLESIFALVKSAQDLTPPRQFHDGEIKRLFIRYLIRAAYAAMEVSLRSTVSCDENYLAKPEKVPFHEFDLVSVMDVRNDFISAQLRLCGTRDVLASLASRMLGKAVKIEPEMIDDMALEMLNLIYGQAKSQLNDKESFRLPSAIPRLLPLAQFAQVKRASSLSILPLVTPMGAFYVEVELI